MGDLNSLERAIKMAKEMEIIDAFLRSRRARYVGDELHIKISELAKCIEANSKKSGA